MASSEECLERNLDEPNEFIQEIQSIDNFTDLVDSAIQTTDIAELNECLDTLHAELPVTMSMFYTDFPTFTKLPISEEPQMSFYFLKEILEAVNLLEFQKTDYRDIKPKRKIRRLIFRESPITYNDGCPICMRADIEEPIKTVCGHMFCKMCVATALENKKECPICRESIFMNELSKPVKRSKRLAKKEKIDYKC